MTDGTKVSEHQIRVQQIDALPVRGRVRVRQGLVPPGAIDAKWVLDAGNNGIMMNVDHRLEPREHA